MAKVLLSIDDKLLRRIDRAAKAQHVSRSAYLAHLAEDSLVGTSKATRARSARALALLESLSIHAPKASHYDSTSAIREERDARS